MQKVDFYFKDEITLADFLTDRQYREFMGSARVLGVKVRKETALDTLRKVSL